MRYLGIDFGTKRIGLALSDETGVIVNPFDVVENNKKSLDSIVEICNINNIGKIIIGDSKDNKMNDNPLMEEIESFKKKLEERINIPVEYHLEFFTSVQVEKEKFLMRDSKSRKPVQKNTMLDAEAAAIMLQSYLDINKI